MSPSSEATGPAVPPEEVARRIDDYRRMGFEQQAKPQVVYHPPCVVCPWPRCDYRIAAVDFHVEKMGDPQLYSRVIPAFWQGPGLVAKCPGCRRHVLFGMEEKTCVSDPAAGNFVILPDDWHQYAYIVH